MHNKIIQVKKEIEIYKYIYQYYPLSYSYEPVIVLKNSLYLKLFKMIKLDRLAFNFRSDWLNP